MLFAIESLVRFFEELLVTTRLKEPDPPPWYAANDNGEMDAEDHRWAAYR
ncbi:hypothetical protein [Hyphomicrobium sp. CS1GBMeth3]|nr:hypothetical protein [Hyphomicrobium sp. CS1GBMeth3]